MANSMILSMLLFIEPKIYYIVFTTPSTMTMAVLVELCSTKNSVTTQETCLVIGIVIKNETQF
jgi:hypothetical protein